MRFYKLFILCFTVAALSSCKLFRSNLMLKTPPNFNYDKLNDSISKLNYRLAPTDEVNYKIFTNDGFRLVEMTAGTITTGNTMVRNDLNVIIEADGTAKFPLIGRVKIAGMSKVEAETFLEEKYTEFYVKPFIILKIMNKRVTVFPGNGGDARVVDLANNNTSVIEALALAGGIREDGKAYKVKLIRNNPGGKPFVYLMDLSTIDGLGAGRSIVQANDIIYVEPRYRLAKTLVNEITPILTLLSTTLIIFTYINRSK